MPGKPVSVRLPDDVRAAIGDDVTLSRWLVDAARQRLAAEQNKPRWRPLLGDDLADRVAALTTDPGRFCLDLIRSGVELQERDARRRADTAARRAACTHPPKARRGNRCTDCGARRLPAA